MIMQKSNFQSIKKIIKDLFTYPQESLCNPVDNSLKTKIKKNIVDNPHGLKKLSTGYPHLCFIHNLLINKKLEIKKLTYTHIHSPYYYCYFKILFKGL